jgi:hypothetical protein
MRNFRSSPLIPPDVTSIVYVASVVDAKLYSARYSPFATRVIGRSRLSPLSDLRVTLNLSDNVH